MGGFINGQAWNDTFNHPNSTIIGTVVSLYEVGGFIGGIVSSFVGERFGRRQSIGFGAIFLTIGAVLQSTSYSMGQLMFSRIVSGIGVGIQQSSIPSLQSEVSPKGQRGVYAAAYLTMLNFGILLSYWINYGVGFVNNDFGWRFPTAFQLVFVISVFYLTFIIPESPRWLMLHDRNEDAAEVISALLDKPVDDSNVTELLNQIKSAVSIELAEGNGSWVDFIKEDGLQTRRRLWTACLVQIFQQ